MMIRDRLNEDTAEGTIPRSLVVQVPSPEGLRQAQTVPGPRMTTVARVVVPRAAVLALVIETKQMYWTLR